MPLGPPSMRPGSSASADQANVGWTSDNHADGSIVCLRTLALKASVMASIATRTHSRAVDVASTRPSAAAPMADTRCRRMGAPLASITTKATENRSR